MYNICDPPKEKTLQNDEYTLSKLRLKIFHISLPFLDKLVAIEPDTLSLKKE